MENNPAEDGVSSRNDSSGCMEVDECHGIWHLRFKYLRFNVLITLPLLDLLALKYYF